MHISEVDRGKKCDCACPACELSLLAKKGPKLAEHFAHQDGMACSGVRETNAHAWAKKVLGERKEIYLPPVIGSVAGARSAREVILYCIAPAFRAEPVSDLHNAICRAEPGFIFPSASIARYLDGLADRRVLQHDSYDVFRLDEDEASSLRHRADH